MGGCFLKTNEAILFKKSDLEAGINVPDWFTEEYLNYKEKVCNKDFPCYFATTAENKGDLYYSYVEDDLLDAVKALKTFLEKRDANNIYEQNIIIFFKPELQKKNIEFYRKRTWEILNFLHENDPSGWPSDVPKDPEDPQWGFCFGGEELFITSCFPPLLKRKSRNLGNSLVLVIQPNSIFNGIESHNPKGRKVRQLIRTRLGKWDDVPPHPDLSELGEVQGERWKNYVYDDDNIPFKGKCSFKNTLQYK